MLNFFRKIRIGAGLFNGHFVDVKTLYAAEFNKMPCVTFIGDIDVTKAFSFVNETCKADIKATYQHCYFDHDERHVHFNCTIVVLNFERMIEIADNYCQLLDTPRQYNRARMLVMSWHSSEL